MYTNILILTDGSELAGKAVQHGIELAKRSAPSHRTDGLAAFSYVHDRHADGRGHAHSIQSTHARTCRENSWCRR